MGMRVQTFSSHPDKPPSGRYSDVDVVGVLAAAVEAVLAAESEVRAATAALKRVLLSARSNHQDRQADDALRTLAARRSS